MSKNNKLPKVLVIIGPTTSNKTKLAIKIANLFNGEIINADAYQVYKEMQIGTNAPTSYQKKKAKFHLNQFISIIDEWNIKKFQTLCKEVINEITNKKKLPILVGGSGLYINVIVENYKLIGKQRDENKFENFSNEYLYQKLIKFDKRNADKFNLSNRRRLIRAVQLYEDTSLKNPLNLKEKKEYDTFIVEANYKTREQLYASINKKVDEMIKEGWVDEIKKIVKIFPKTNFRNINAFKAIGYLQIFESIKNNSPIDIDKIKRDIRHYAKRQITWIKNKCKTDVLFDQTNETNVLHKVRQWIKK